MTPDQRTDAEAKADRAVRRGELATALSLYQAIVKAFPSDAVIAKKLKRVEEMLQPTELTSSKVRQAAEGPPPSHPMEQAEAFANAGRYAEAIALYRKLLAEKPESVLLKERLGELFDLAQAQAGPARPSPHSSAPQQSREGEERAPGDVLSSLLGRISSRKR